MIEWIPVSERLPDEGVEVLGTALTNSEFGSAERFYVVVVWDGRWWNNDEGYAWERDELTHWADLTPPKEAESD